MFVIDYILVIAYKECQDMNVSLTPELEKLVNEKVASGLYNSASEVIREDCPMATRPWA